MPEKENKEETYEEVNIEELRRAALESMPGHNWKLRGTVLTCTSCPFTHSHFLAPEQVEKVLKALD
jgi:hypothetical protein